MASKKIRWLHLSDFHVGKDEDPQRRMFERIIKFVKSNVDAGFIPDFLFVTGDLADKGKEGQYETFNYEFLDPLQKVLGSAIVTRTYVIPGNHDVDQSKHQAFDRQEMSAPANHYFDGNDEGKSLREIILPRFKAFADTDCSAPKGLWLKSASGSFSTIEDLDDVKVGIVGINTAWLCKDKNDREKLTPGVALLEDALSQIKESQVRIVLGHHPINWLLPKEQPMIKSLLGQSHAIYLHGHLHDAWVEPTYGSGGVFLAVQCGAGFQAREGEPWKNGLLFGEIDFETQALRLQPWTWNKDHKDWVLASESFPNHQRNCDWWEYPLPGTLRTTIKEKKVETSKPEMPKGWSVATVEELKVHTGSLDLKTAINYFNGAVPNWKVALSSSTPKRMIVEKLVALFDGGTVSDRPVVGLLLGAGCEGKTTVLLQTAFQVLERHPQWKILRRSDESQGVKPAQLLPLLDANHDWLVVIDDADNAARGVIDLIGQMDSKLRAKVHFLLACRDSDWLSARASALPWSTLSLFKQERLSGLQDEDAKAIVEAWGAFGNEGLGKIATIPKEKRTLTLIEAAREESKLSHGAFFGALLTVRLGEDIRNHAKAMLEHLGQRTIPGGKTLQDALAYISAMHSEGLDFLSRPVLASVLGCPTDKLRKEVLLPLGEEAAAATTSEFIYTRHPRIAQAILEVLTSEFGDDSDTLFIRLTEAAIDAAKRGEFIPPNVSCWRYKMPEHFFKAGRKDLAIAIGNGVHSRERHDFKSVVNLAQLYRKAGAQEQALNLFREFSFIGTTGRGFYSEWAAAEGNFGNQGVSVLLSAYSLADQCASIPPSLEDGKLALAGIGVGFRELYDSFRNSQFADGLAATAILGQQFATDARAHYFENYIAEAIKRGAKVPNLDNAMETFKNAVSVAMGYVSDEGIKGRIGNPAVLTYEGLRKLTSYEQ